MNKPITLTEVGDAVALGSAMLAAMGAGIYSDLQEAADNMVHDLETIEPDAEKHEEYSYYLDQYMQGYPQMQELIHGVVDHEGAKK